MANELRRADPPHVYCPQCSTLWGQVGNRDQTIRNQNSEIAQLRPGNDEAREAHRFLDILGVPRENSSARFTLTKRIQVLAEQSEIGGR